MAKLLSRKSIDGKDTRNIRRIEKLLNDHYNGNPWIDTTVTGTLKSLTAKQASEKYGMLNSIWQIVNHMVHWRRALLTRVRDNRSVSPPANNFIDEIKDTSPAAWKQALKDFENSQKELMKFLKDSEDTMLETISPASGYSYYELLLAILLHDTYHIGQIAILKKMLKK